MSTSYYVYCETCRTAVTDENECDNHPEIPLTIVANIIAYAHFAMALEELPTPRYSFLDWDFRISGHRIDLHDIRKHATHQLAVYNEYGYVYPSKSCSHCKSSICSKVKNRGQCEKRQCCDKCDHEDP